MPFRSLERFCSSPRVALRRRLDVHRSVLRIGCPLSQSSGIQGDWPRVWIQTKVALIDAFHALLSTDLSSAPTELGQERVFDTLFSLLDLGIAHLPPHKSHSSHCRL